MDTIHVHFNKPHRPVDLSGLLNDLRHAQSSLIVASAWFTDTAIADAIIAASAATKIILLNAADINRASVEAYQRLENYFTTAKASSITPTSGLYVLGGEDWRHDGMMHHKYVVIDAAVVWIGSYNLTTFAQQNYETLVRIVDTAVAGQFVEETRIIQKEARISVTTST